MEGWRWAAIALLAIFAPFAAPASAQTLQLPASAQLLQPVKIGIVRPTSGIPIIIAADKGYFADEGLDASLIWFESPGPVVTATMSGAIDFGSAGFSGALFNIGAKGAITLIAAQARDSAGYHLDALMATRRGYSAGFSSPATMAGRRIGLTMLGSSSHFALALLAQKYGVTLSSIQLVPLQGLPLLSAAFARGSIDGGLIASPAAQELQADGSGAVLAWTGDEAPSQLGAEIATPRMLHEHPDLAVKFLRAYRRGLDTYQKAVQFTPAGAQVNGPGFAEIAEIIARHLNTGPDELGNLLPDFSPGGELDMADLKRQIAFFQQQGLVDRNANAEAMVDLSLLAKAKGR